MTGPDATREPFVLLAGMNCSAALWARVPGLDAALHPALTETSMDTQVDRLLDELPARFAVGGLSLGAIVAMALVRRAPERVLRLVLMSTNPHAPTAGQLAGWRRDRDRLAAGESARNLQEAWLPSLLSESARCRTELVEATLAMADEVGTRTLDGQLRLQATRVDERPGLASIRCPTTVVAAAADRLCGLDRHRELQALIPGSRLTMLPGVGHLSPLEAPAAVAAELRGGRRAGQLVP